MTGVDTLSFAGRYALLAGALCLDATAVAQAMFSQPLVACALLGTVFGEPAAGITTGIAFQLLFAGDLPIGSHMPKDAPLVSMGALGAAMVDGRRHALPVTDERLAAAAFLALAAEPLCGLMWVLVRRVNDRICALTRHLLGENRRRLALVAAQGGILTSLAGGSAAVLLLAGGGAALLDLFVPLLPAGGEEGLRWAFVLLPFIGTAHFLSRMERDDMQRYTPEALLHLLRRER
jgi:mannose/fructose/N-acetylgalactosamine-specific phosphotransferase system component IIC